MILPTEQTRLFYFLARYILLDIRHGLSRMKYDYKNTVSVRGIRQFQENHYPLPLILGEFHGFRNYSEIQSGSNRHYRKIDGI